MVNSSGDNNTKRNKYSVTIVEGGVPSDDPTLGYKTWPLTSNN